MRRLVVTRIAWMVPAFVLITALTFAMAHLAPGDPLQLSEDAMASSATVREARAQLELDRPLAARYLRWLTRAVQGELGRSVVDRVEVSSKLREALPRTVLVSGLALLFACGFSIALGVLLAAWRNAWWARAFSGALALASGVPSFWVAVLALLFLATPRGIELFPLQGLSSPAHLVLPVACLAWPTIAMLTRYVASSVTASLDLEFIRAARARGLDERTVFLRHALPNALLPLVAVVGLHLPQVFTGSVLIERVFGISGMGLLAFEAIGTRDYPVVMGATTVMAMVTLVSLLVTDVLAMIVDPRLRVGVRR